MEWYILVIFCVLLFPFYMYILSKVQMLGWLKILNRGGCNGKKASEQVPEEGIKRQQKAADAG
jgi:hypothetical protein